MSKTELSSAARKALVALLLHAKDAVGNPELQERFRVKIEKEPRETLADQKLVQLQKSGNSFLHTLTPAGRERALAELVASPFSGQGPGFLMLNALARVFNGVLLQQGLHVDKVFAQDGEMTPSQSSIEPTQELVLSTYHDLVKRRGDLLSLVKFRGRLSDVDRADLDKLLKTMDRQRVIQLEPDPNQKALTTEAREAAIRIGGEDMHFITIGHR